MIFDEEELWAANFELKNTFELGLGPIPYKG